MKVFLAISSQILSNWPNNLLAKYSRKYVFSDNWSTSQRGEEEPYVQNDVVGIGVVDVRSPEAAKDGAAAVGGDKTLFDLAESLRG